MADILDILLSLAPTVVWLDEAEPIHMQKVPAEHSTRLKQLENLGLVYRRNSHSCGLQRRRLIKLLTRESLSATSEKRSQCLSAFARILEERT